MRSGIVRVLRSVTAIAVIAASVITLTGVETTPVSAVTGTNEQINFQGRLFNAQGAVVPDGYYNIQFKIYQDGDGQSVGNTTGSPAGSLKWTESHLNAAGKGVLVKNGYLSVELGSVTAFGSSVDWNQSVLWLSMNIGNTNTSCATFATCAPDGEMVPMKRLSSTPYAMNTARLGNLTSSQFVQLAQGVQTDAVAGSSSIFINKTAAGGNFLNFQQSGVSALAVTDAGNLTFGANANHSLTVATAASGTGKSLTLVAGGGGADSAGGALVLQGGNGGSGNANGGNVTIYGGTGSGTGVRGLVNIGPAAFSSGTDTPCATSCTISQSLVDTYGTVVVSASATDIDITLPAPTITTAGRTIYISTSSASQDFNLRTNSGADQIDVAMRKNTTSTMIWNGTAWTPGGASNATTLQATYNNGSNPATTPEIKLDSIRGTIDIQDADVSINADLLNIRGSNANGLGTVLFGVSDTGRVTIQGTTDQNSAFRVLDSNGNYQLNVNSANGYIINNSVDTAGNEIDNPGFEAGGLLSSGEEGWFGPALASIVNDNTNARNGNHLLQVTANSSQIDVYAGTYYEVRPGDILSFRGWVKNSAGANGTAGIQLTWYDRNKSVLSYTTDYGSLPGTSYVQRSVSGTAPAGAAYVKASAVVRPSATTGTFYFDDFAMSNALETGAYTFRNGTDSTNAFKIQSAGSAQTLFTADTTNNRLKVGDSTGSDTGTTLLVLDNTVADPSTNLQNGGLFYRSDTNSLKAVIGGAVVDICTTAVTCSGYSASAGSSIQLQTSSPGTAQTGNFNITGTGILTQLQTQDNGSGNSQNLNIRTGNATGGGSGNLTLDTGTASGTRGSITIGTGNVAVTMGGTLAIQGSNTLALGQASANTGSILFRSAAGSNTVTLRGPTSTGTSYALTLPSNLGASGECMKTDATGNIYFQGCGVGVNYNLQDAYNNSDTPANITLTDGKDLTFTSAETANDANFIFKLQCTIGCDPDSNYSTTNNGRFAIQGAGTDALSVDANGSVYIGSKTSDSVTHLFQFDSYNGTTDPTGTNYGCSSTVNQGALYYNSTMGSIRGCINGTWNDISNPDTLGLLSFGIVPSSGNQSYDLPALVQPGYSGPCKVSLADSNTVHIEPCVAYTNGRRVTVPQTNLDINVATSPNTNLTGTNRWGHICLNPISGVAEFTSNTGFSSATAGMPDSNAQFDAGSPIVCLADILATSAGGVIDDIYDTRTFTSAMKEAVNLSTATELGMLVDAGTAGAMTPAVSASAKLYGTVVATNGQTSAGAPNAIVTTVGPAWVKANAGTAGQFIKTSTTNGYGNTTSSIPNNSFYYSVGNTRTSYSTACTTAADCSASLYVNFIVR